MLIDRVVSKSYKVTILYVASQDSLLIARRRKSLLMGQHIQVQGNEIFHLKWCGGPDKPHIQGLDITLAFPAKINAIALFFLACEVPKVLYPFILTEGALKPWIVPLMATELAVEESLALIAEVGHVRR